MRIAKRVTNLPPYLFAELERKIEERAAGVEVISLGIGDPDVPTPGGRGRGGAAPGGAARHPPVPVQPRPARVPRGGGDLLPAPLRRRARPRHRDPAAPGRQGGRRARLLRDARPGRRLPRRRSRLPVYTSGDAARRGRAGADAADGRARLPARPRRRSRPTSAGGRTCSSATTRTTPPAP